MSRIRHTDGDFYLAGWRVRSEFRIAALPPWTGEEKPPDILIRTGPVPGHPSALVLDGPLLRIAGDGSCWFDVPGLAAFFVNGEATEVTIEAVADPAGSAVCAFLLGTVFGILCHKRRLLPIHASCVEIGGRAVAFAGPSGIGKSLLAAAFMKAGCAVISDDIAVIDTAAPGGPVVLPSFPWLRLWRDGLQDLGFDSGRYERTRPEIEKYDLPAGSAFSTQPRRLSALYYLRRERKGGDSITRLHGAHAVRDAAEAVYCAQAAGALAGENAMIPLLVTLCSAAPGYVLAHQPGFEALPARVAALLAKHGRAA